MEIDPRLDIPLLGHFGLLDSLAHALASASTYADVLLDEADDDEIAEGLRESFEQASAALALMRDSLSAGTTREQSAGTGDPHSRPRQRWVERCKTDRWTPAERWALERLAEAS